MRLPQGTSECCKSKYCSAGVEGGGGRGFAEFVCCGGQKVVSHNSIDQTSFRTKGTVVVIGLIKL
jgi:hypothetical protein